MAIRTRVIGGVLVSLCSSVCTGESVPAVDRHRQLSRLHGSFPPFVSNSVRNNYSRQCYTSSPSASAHSAT